MADPVAAPVPPANHNQQPQPQPQPQADRRPRVPEPAQDALQYFTDDQCSDIDRFFNMRLLVDSNENVLGALREACHTEYDVNRRVPGDAALFTHRYDFNQHDGFGLTRNVLHEHLDAHMSVMYVVEVWRVLQLLVLFSAALRIRSYESVVILLGPPGFLVPALRLVPSRPVPSRTTLYISTHRLSESLQARRRANTCVVMLIAAMALFGGICALIMAANAFDFKVWSNF